MFRTVHSSIGTVRLVLFVLTLSLVSQARAITTNWIAFNDHTPTTPAGSSAAEWNTQTNVTVYNMRGVTDNPPQPTQGPLTNFLTGEQLNAYLICTANGSPDYFGSISYPNPGSPASN